MLKKSQETKATDPSQKIKSKLNRLEKQLARREAELQIVNSIQEKLASRLDFQTIIDLVGDQMRAITKASGLFVALSDTTSKIISWPYCVNNNERIESPSAPLSKNITRSLFYAAKPLNLGTEQEILAYGAISQEGFTVGKSFLGIPFTVGNAMLGVVSIHDIDHEHAFTAAAERLLQTLTNAMSVALEKARLFAETQRLFKAQQQRNIELQVINSVQEGLASRLEMKAIYQLVGEKISEIFTADTTFIATYEHGNQYVDPQYYVEKGQAHVLNEPLLFGEGLYTQVIQSRKYLRVGSTEEQQQLGAVSIPSPDSDEDLNQSFLGVPLLLSENITGVVSVQSYRKNAYTENDVRLLTTIANSMSVALENARLFDETQRLLKETEQQNAELQIINSVQEGLVSRLEMQAIYELVGAKIRDTFNAQVVNIATYDRATQLMHGRYYFEGGEAMPSITLPSFGFRKHAVENRKPVMINNDMSYWMEVYDNPVIQGAQSKSAVFVPMLVGEEAIGVISLQNVDREHAFSGSDLRLLETLASSMSIALENARLWEQEKLLRKALERELEIGRDIQAGFLPEALPVVEGWEIAATLVSAREVAGDFYDAFELPDGNIGLVIADVCDKGVGAALFMTLFRSLIRVTSNQEYFEHYDNSGPSLSMAERLQHAMMLTNNYIAKTHQDSGMFATVFFGILEPRERRLIYINGGHEPPFIVQSGEVRESLSKTGPAVGAIRDAHFEVHSVQLNPDEMFFAFTDGAPDAKDPHGAFFGRGRLLDILQRHRGSAHELVKIIEAELHHYMDSAIQFDDITLLAVRQSSDY
jgi:serine phosphatase RsbU (regulator of sigma subunit)